MVGFGEEPAYAGQPNSLWVISRDGKPATDLLIGRNRIEPMGHDAYCMECTF